MTTARTDSALERLRASRQTIVSAWMSCAFGVYPADTSRFFSEEPDPFRNPVGNIFREQLAALFDGLIGGLDPEQAAADLAALVRVLAVQDLTASDPVAFIPALKGIVRSAIGERVDGDELRLLDGRIDRLHRLASEQIACCRVRMAEILNHERARRTWLQDRVRTKKREASRTDGA